MQSIKVGRYSPEGTASHGWAGWLEPEDRSWIAFVKSDGSVRFYLHRDPETGAVRDDADVAA